MGHRSQGRKTSNFPETTVFPAGTKVPFIADGVNYQMALADFFAALSVTGTIVQEGAVTGTPVLDTAGTVHSIRNLENGSGIQASVSPENGVTLAHNFRLDDTGVELSDDFTALSPVFRSFVPGAGINISGSGDTIQISSSEIPASTKTVVVNAVSDLPAAVGGVITLEDDTEYLFNNDVNIGTDRLVLGDNCVISGASSVVITITYTGSDDMITGTDVTARVERITLACASGRAFNITDTTTTFIFRIADVNVSACDELGLITGIGLIEVANCTFSNQATSGFTFAGVIGGIIIDFCLAVMQTGSFVDMGSAVAQSIDFDSNLFELVGAGAVGFTATGSTNVANIGTVFKNRFRGAGTAISGFDKDDIQWIFSLNEGLPDTRRDSLSVNRAGTTVTIGIISTPVVIGGTWIDDNSSQFTVDGAGRVTYNGIVPLHVPISLSVTADPVSGSNKDFQVCLGFNGTVVTDSSVPARASAGDLRAVMSIWQLVFEQGDFVETFIQNDTDTVDFNVTKAVLRVN